MQSHIGSDEKRYFLLLLIPFGGQFSISADLFADIHN